MNEQAAGAVRPLSEPVEPPVRIQLNRGQQGRYGWEVTARGDTVDAVIAQVVTADTRLRTLYVEVKVEEKDD